MLALFHDKKCCNCFNLFPCILWDFIVLGLVLSWWRLKLNWRSVHFATSLWEVYEKGSHEKACEKHMTRSWRVVPGCCFHKCLAGKAFSRDSCKTFCLEVFLSVTCLPFTHAIYTLITHKCKKGHSERKTLDRFSTTHTPIFLKESYSSLVRNHCSLFSIPLSLS